MQDQQYWQYKLGGLLRELRNKRMKLVMLTSWKVGREHTADSTGYTFLAKNVPDNPNAMPTNVHLSIGTGMMQRRETGLIVVGVSIQL